MPRRRLVTLISLSVLIVALFGAGLFFVKYFLWPSQPTFGVAYSNLQARFLGLDEKGTFDAVVSKLGVKHLRLPVYWSEVQHSSDQYDWSLIDYYMAEAAKHDVKVTLVIGFKTPRWPECHIPDFVSQSTDPQVFENNLTSYLLTAVNRYKSSPVLERWQVENEPLFPFGNCPLPDIAVLNKEIAEVRSADIAHPIQLTVSGEQEPWLSLAGPADILGVSLYRFVWNSAAGIIILPHSPIWYAVHRLMVTPWVEKVVISELQAEPWFDNGLIPKSLEQSYAAFPVERLREHLDFARQTGFHEVYIWGVEWWYYLHIHGEDRLWNEGKTLFE